VRGKNRVLVGSALGYLMQQQGKDGRIGPAGLDPLEHVLATLALCDAYGQMQAAADAQHDGAHPIGAHPIGAGPDGGRGAADIEALRRSCESALPALVRLQDAQGRIASGLSVHATAWAQLAFERAHAAGLDADGAARARGWTSLAAGLDRRLADLPLPPPGAGGAWVSAASLLLMREHGLPGDVTRALRDGISLATASREPPGADPAPLPAEELLWSTALLYRIGGPAWDVSAGRGLADAQDSSAERSGSWDPARFPGPFGTREDTTALCSLATMIHWRYEMPLTSGWSD
jgi:hypothetical protein